MTIVPDSTAPLFVVVGASGTQGGSVIRAIHASSKAYRVRALARDISKPSLNPLEKLGAELFTADTGKPDDVKKAFAGADVAFLMTQVSAGTNEEYVSGKLQVETAEAAGVKSIIWASLPAISKSTGGTHQVPHWDLKADVAEWARSANLKAKFYEILPGCYDQNFTTMMAPRKQEDGSFVLSLAVNADTDLPMIDMDQDFGNFCIAALEKDITWPVLASQSYATPTKLAADLSKFSGKKVVFQRLPDEVLYKTTEQFAGADMANDIIAMFKSIREVGYCNGQDLTESNAILDKPARDFAQYLEANRETYEKILA